MTTPFPKNNARAWDYIVIDGRRVPCLTDYPKTKRAKKTDAKSAFGRNGARVVDRGYGIAEVSVTVWLWTEEHFREWDAILAAILPPAGTRQRNAVAIEHPTLAQLAINQIIVKSVGSIDAKGKGLFSVAFEALEYNPEAMRPRSRGNATQVPRAQFATATALDGPQTTAPGASTPAAPASPRAARSGT